MADEAPTPRPGWYPEPSGDGQRWWDGARWSDAEPPTIDSKRPSAIGVYAFAAGAAAVAAGLFLSSSAYAFLFVAGTIAIALAFGARRRGDHSPLAVAGAVLGVLSLGIGVWAYSENQRVDRCEERYTDLIAGRGVNLAEQFEEVVKDCGDLFSDG